MTAAVAAILLLKEQELLDRFRQVGAVSRETAMTADALSISEDMTFRRLRDRGVIRAGAAGTFYLDEAAIVMRRQTARRWARMLAIVLAVMAVVLIVLMNRGAAA